MIVLGFKLLNEMSQLCSVKNYIIIIIMLLQEDVNAILVGAKDNNMELNEDKCQTIQHGKISHLKPSTSEIYKTSQGTSLNPTDVVADLNVTINEGLNW